ncbi:MAG TPA: amino acid adenylation domain-containing protein, partial [Longimicrobiaceae bacterium]|nr:amino acid adenylation domain-containing protein [Longimicrobiaceae bacterium]
LSAETTGALRALARAEGATLFMALLAGWQALLGRWSGQEDVVVGSPIAGRTREETEGLIGFFVNTLALRAELRGDPAFRALLGRVREGTLGAYTHQDLPFERLVEALGIERSLTHAPLFQTTVALQEAEGDGPRLRGLEVGRLPGGSARAKFDLSLALWEEDGRLRGALAYASALWDGATARRMLDGLGRLLEGAAADPGRPLSGLPLLAPAERETLLAGWNPAPTAYPRERGIPELFAEQAAGRPDAPALAFGGERMSYAELDRRSAGLAAALRARGVGERPEVPVGLFLERSADLVVAMLAVLRAGGCYVPLDPDHPAERLAYVLADTGAEVLVTRSGLLERRPAGPAAVVCVDRPAAEPSPASPPRVEADSLAYVVYTSGSTGRPKGIAVPHRGVVRLVRDADYVRLGPDDRVAQASNAAFDAATFEVWGALLNGACLVGVDRDTALTPARLAVHLREEGITTLFLTTALFNQTVREAPDAFDTLRHLLFGGEAVDPAAVRACLEAGRPGRLLHVYGPTENTTYSSWHAVDEVASDAATVPIGRALAQGALYVLDRWMEPVPRGVPGELYVGGDGLARGYVGQPALTADRFVPDPFGAPGGRLYRTGDRVRWNARGEVEFLGRVDFQVKIRGFRIEPGEVEAVLAAHPQVRDAVVVVHEAAPGDRRLAAYAGAEEGERPAAAALRAWLAERLPEYMVPAALAVLDRLPLNANGKVDRAALPEPDYAGEADGSREPRTPTEEVLAGIFAQVLGVERVGRDDDFFAIGGHSLLATRVVSRARKAFRIELPVRNLFEWPTVAGLAARVDVLLRSDLGVQAPPVVPVPRDRALPLSFAQQRLWFIDQLDPGSAAYNMPVPLRLRGRLDGAALERALGEVVRRHESLRTRFPSVGGEPVQVVEPAAAPRLPRVDLARLDDGEREARRLAGEDAARGFDLATGPLFRAALLRLGAEDHALLLNVHHAVSDGWSTGVLFRELS